MINKPPRIKYGDVVAALFMYVGLLFLIVALQIIANSSSGNTQTVLFGVFTYTLWIYVSLVVLGGVAVLIQLLRLLVWQVFTPAWVKNEMKNDANAKRNE